MGRSSSSRQAGGEEEEEEHTSLHEFKHHFEKLNGFKMKGMWAGTEAAGAGKAEAAVQEFIILKNLMALR